MARFNVSFDGVMDRLEELERENHRLVRQLADAMAIAEVVANGPVYRDDFGEYVCHFCEQRYMTHEDLDDDQPGQIEHASDCPVTKARALLSATPSGDETGEDGELTAEQAKAMMEEREWIRRKEREV